MTSSASASAPAGQTSLLPVNLPVVKALLDSASDKGAVSSGVLGVRSRPTWAGPQEFRHGGLSVTVAACPSALAVREALLSRDRSGWLVVLTDRDEQDLGTGITAHLHRRLLRTPNPWDAVREQFAATRIDHRLAAQPREIATGLLAARRDAPWLPARGGLLTLEHAYAAVASSWFGLPSAVEAIDIESVLAWSTRLGDTTQVSQLRAVAGDPLTDAALGWLASRCGSAAPLLETLLRTGRIGDAVPLGLAGRAVLGTPEGSEPWLRLSLRELGVDQVAERTLTALVLASEAVTQQLLRGSLGSDPTATATLGRVLARADSLVASTHAAAGIEGSDLLRGSLTTRLGRLGDTLRRAVASAAVRAGADRPDAVLADQAVLPDVEAALGRVEQHALARLPAEQRVDRALAGVRLVRWLAVELPPTANSLEAAFLRHRDDDCWVDRAYADAWCGVAEESLASGLEAVLAAVRLRRDVHDREFGQALAAYTGSPSSLPGWLMPVEDLLARVVVPIAHTDPVLLVVADGMSAAIGTEVAHDVEGRFDAWLECLPEGQVRRSAAITALPSLTEVSRCSLLSGSLATGGQNAERTAFAALMHAHGLTSKLLHKLSLDASGGGFDLSPEVTAAIDGVSSAQVVACVLNTIDDALDRSDPGGVDWTADAVKHLVPLLERARRAGRVVVLTSDHGHIIERREATQQTAPGISSNRSRPFAGGQPVETGEVRVTGKRVLLHDGDAVLAVDERLRYGPLKAGYHGGAAPAEVVVPVHVFAQGQAPVGWQLAAPQQPDWWNTAVQAGPKLPAPAPAHAPVKPSDPPTLFDHLPAIEPIAAGPDLAAAVVGSPVYAEQRARAARVPLTDAQVTALLRRLLGTPAHRLDRDSAAAALGVPVVQLNGALPMVKRLLNVEQYPVLDRDPDGATIVLDVELMREQFAVGP